VKESMACEPQLSCFWSLATAPTKLIKADLAAEIIGVLRERHLTGAAAGKLTGVPAADIYRIRHADLARFTIDRLVNILNRLNRHGEVRVTVRAMPTEHAVPVLS
jgi:predicted XRE-type DNA-binding protein